MTSCLSRPGPLPGRRVVFCLFLVLLALAGSGNSKADSSDSDTVKLPDISVTSTRGRSASFQMPLNVTQIGADAIRTQSPTVLSDVLESVPGINITDTTGTGYSSNVDMRGFGETGNLHTLVLIDGQRMNNMDLSGLTWSTIPMENVECIDVIHGPGTVRYGDNAVGGVINLITKEGSGPLSGSVQGKYGSYNQWGFQGFAQQGGENLSGYVSVRNDSTDGYREHSEARFYNFNLDGRYYATDTILLKLDGGYAYSESQLPGSLTELQVLQDRRQAGQGQGDVMNQTGYLFLQTRKDWGPLGMLIADVAGMYRLQDSRIGTGGLSDTYTGRLQPRYVLEGDLWKMRHEFTAGIDFFYNFLDADTTDEKDTLLWADTFRFIETAPYLLEEVHLVPQIVLTAGARYQFAAYALQHTPAGQGSQQQDYNQNEPAWTIGLTWPFAGDSKLFGGVTRVFNYPAVDQYLSYGGVFSDLKPETGMNYQAGVLWAPLPGASLSATAYCLNMNNEIYYNPQAQKNENLANTRHLGVEGSVSAPVWRDRIVLSGSMTFQNVKFTLGPYDGKWVPLVPQWLASAGVQVRPISGLQTGLRFHYVGPRIYGNDFMNQFGEMKDFFALDLNLSYTWKWVNVFFNANNVTGEEYSTFAFATDAGKGYYPEPEANFLGGVRVALP